jgi:tetratricopeptide (TPR) repeat protein
LAEILGGLPLALEQAAAYVLRNRMTLGQYRESWGREQDRVLDWFDPRVMSYDRSLAVTFQQTVGQFGSTAEALLRLLAYLAPEPIPEELFLLGARMIYSQEAERLMEEALALGEKEFRSVPPVATAMNNLAQLLKATDRLDRAKSLMHQALAIDEASFGPAHPSIARDLSNLANLVHACGDQTQAESLLRRALAIDETAFGHTHPNVARDLNNLAILLRDTGRLPEAAENLQRARDFFEERLGPTHSHTQKAGSALARLRSEVEEQKVRSLSAGRRKRARRLED